MKKIINIIKYNKNILKYHTTYEKHEKKQKLKAITIILIHYYMHNNNISEDEKLY